jgi:hypothetical protein
VIVPWSILGLAGAAVVGSAGYWLGSTVVQAKFDHERAEWAGERASAMRQSLQQAEKFLAKAQADADNLAKVQADGQARLTAALADRDAADRRAAGLRSTADAAVAALRRGTTQAPATAAECAAADAAARVFADVFRRADERAGILAAAADAARIAGQACVSADEITR